LPAAITEGYISLQSKGNINTVFNGFFKVDAVLHLPFYCRRIRLGCNHFAPGAVKATRRIVFGAFLAFLILPLTVLITLFQTAPTITSFSAPTSLLWRNNEHS
jgi:hypothetical protein